MINIVDVFKSSPIFSKKISRANLFFFLALGPFLLITALSIALYQFSGEKLVFPFIMLGTLILSYKGKLKGFFISSVIILTYFFVTFPKEAFWWHCSFSISLLCGLFITALLSDEIYRFVTLQLKVKDEGVLALSMHIEQLEQLNEQKMFLSSSNTNLQKRVDETIDYGDSLKKLIQVSETESHCLRAENRKLTENLELLHERANALQAEKNEGVTQEGKDPLLLDELNQFRVENYQLRLLLESYEEELEKYKKIDAEKSRLLFEKISPAQSKTEQLDFLQADGDEMQRIMSLTQEKEHVKKEFQKLLIDYEDLSKRFEETVFKSKLDGHEEYNCITAELEEKSETLRQTRNELFKMEGELLTAQKEQSEKDLDISQTEKCLHDYLTFTDQECLRLEEENKELRDIITALTQG